MDIKKVWLFTKRWLRKLIMAFMLGFANVINQETKTIDDTSFKTEQPEK
ncbi:hypothetical protein FHS68_000775 [Dyadobacter arcticus]|uniref:Uncharacterized protein n=1 Tax=Dyadobacter arcticus TaxID=1078754 RepID=A0ABX0UF34_9BACT|nr:hypothetical protein [Dyadobacter arcticus]